MNINEMSDDEKRSVINRLYNEENKTTQEIADILGKTKDSVKHLLKRLNIRKENKTTVVKKEVVKSDSKSTSNNTMPIKSMVTTDSIKSVKLPHDLIIDRLDIIIKKLDILIEKKN